MSSLVAMIVLAYLLVIAVCVAIWTAVSLRRVSSSESGTEHRHARARSELEEQPGDRVHAPRARSDTHDAYRGARAKTRPSRAQGPSAGTSPAPDRTPPATAVPLFTTDREPLPAAPLRAPIALDANGAEMRPEGIRVTESKRIREQSAQRRADEPRKERNTPEDAFERFLRANEDFDR